jgi:hypothetical protein
VFPTTFNMKILCLRTTCSFYNFFSCISFYFRSNVPDEKIIHQSKPRGPYKTHIVNMDISCVKEDDYDYGDDGNWVVLKKHSNYKMCGTYPYPILEISKPHRVLPEWLDSKGYVHVMIGGRPCLKHRLVAIQWVENPNSSQYKIVDHKNNDPSYYHVDNLQWVEFSLNSLNRYGYRGEWYLYLQCLPRGTVRVCEIDENKFDILFFERVTNSFYYYNGFKYRKLVVYASNRCCSCQNVEKICVGFNSDKVRRAIKGETVQHLFTKWAPRFFFFLFFLFYFILF